MSIPNRSVVITGASTGIGATAASWLAAKGWTVFAGVRKAEDGEKLKEDNALIRPLILDVAKQDQVDAAAAEVRDALSGQRLGGLINNAGIAMMGPLALQPQEEFEKHFEVNTFGLLRATRAFLPLLGSDEALAGPPGRIVNISSVGGRVASPFLGAYTATKHAVESLTDSFRREFVVYGVDAICVGPGAVKTPIWSKAEEKNKDTPYKGSPWGQAIEKFSDSMLEAGRTGLEPEKIAQVLEKALSDSKPKARYAPVPNKFTNWTLATSLPKRWLDKVFWGRFDLKSDD